jgi:dTDP-4-dehydrorhamnose 3,5-epimerase
VEAVSRSDGDIAPTSIEGVFLMTPRVIPDERGWFARTFNVEWCRSVGIEVELVQHNQSRSHRGVLRGLHVRSGRGETKLVRCARGSVIDFVVDMRPWSATFRRVERFALDDEANRQLVLAPFVGHGFQVVSAEADVCYLHSRPYEPDAELVVAWDDASLGISWPISPPVLSSRDASAPCLDDLDLVAAFQP